MVSITCECVRVCKLQKRRPHVSVCGGGGGSNEWQQAGLNARGRVEQRQGLHKCTGQHGPAWSRERVRAWRPAQARRSARSPFRLLHRPRPRPPPRTSSSVSPSPSMMEDLVYTPHSLAARNTSRVWGRRWAAGSRQQAGRRHRQSEGGRRVWSGEGQGGSQSATVVTGAQVMLP